MKIVPYVRILFDNEKHYELYCGETQTVLTRFTDKEYCEFVVNVLQHAQTAFRSEKSCLK